jgi:hypothetical protein
VDGSLRDIYVLNITPASWAAFLGFARSKRADLQFEGAPAEFPDPASGTERLSHGHLLVLPVAGAHLHCHFFSSEQIELDIDPAEVISEEDHSAILKFVRELSLFLGLPAIITPENYQEQPFLRFDPEQCEWWVL